MSRCYELHTGGDGRGDVGEVVRPADGYEGPGDALVLSRNDVAYTLQWGQVHAVLDLPARRRAGHRSISRSWASSAGSSSACVNAVAMRMPAAQRRPDRARLCRVLPQHAVAGADLLHLLRPARSRRWCSIPITAVLIGISLNEGAYLTQTLLGGFNSVRREELDAAETLGLRRSQTLLYRRPAAGLPQRSTRRCPTSTSWSR